MIHPAPGETPFLVALERCGVELGAPHLRTTKKRRIETAEVDVETLPSDSLRFVGWAEEALVAVFPELGAEAAYTLEATFLCEREVRRVVSITAGGRELQPPTGLAAGTVTVVRLAVPPPAVADGTLEIRVERVEGPDVVLSELRLFSSEPPARILTVVGDSRGGLIGTVGTVDSSGIADAAVRVSGDGGPFEVRTDAAGVFRVPLREGLALGRHGRLMLSTGVGALETTQALDTRQVALGLRELPPPDDRLDLGGSWRFAGGPFRGHPDAGTELATTRVPGHVIFDALVPEDGVATFHRTFEVPAAWAGRAVLTVLPLRRNQSDSSESKIGSR